MQVQNGSKMAYQAKTSRGSIEGSNQSSIERSAVGSNRVCFCTFLLHFDLRDMYCGEGQETSLKRSANKAHQGTTTFDANKQTAK
jgi:hypothetical protein